MNPAKHAARLQCALELLPSARVVEFVAFGASASNPADSKLAEIWPRRPGAALRGADGWPLILHFAPLRWLLPAPDAGVEVMIAAAVRGGAGTAIDVTGKWAVLNLRGADATRALAATLDVAAVLASRDCAAVELFDCPAIVASAEQGYRLYVKSSYAADFSAACLRRSLSQIENARPGSLLSAGLSQIFTHST